MNIDILRTSFAGTSPSALDTFDPRWAEVSGLVQAGQFREAAQQSDELLRQGVHDVRLIGYLGFGHVLDGGPGALASLLGALCALLTESWDALGPAEHREKATQQSLSWLFKQTLKQLQREESTRSEAWQRWTTQTPATVVEQALADALALGQALELRLGDVAPPVLEGFGKLQAWLRTFQGALVRTIDGVPRTPAPNGIAKATPPTAPTPGGETATRAHEGSGANDASVHLQLLIQKLDAFARLLERRKLAAARLVADDVNEIIAHFDPLLYFPRLFSRFARLMATHADEMAQVEVDREAPAWKALHALYRVDLEAFVARE